MPRISTLILLLILLSPVPLRAGNVVYVSVARDKKIAVYGQDPRIGQLTHTRDVAIAGEPGALTTDAKKRYLFAALRSEGKLSAFRIDPGTGALTHLNTVPAGADPAQISVDGSDEFLLTAYYVAGKVTVHRIREGRLSPEPVQTIATAKMAHAIVPDPSNRFVFVPHTGPNVIFQFRFDSRKGELTATEPNQLKTPPNTGPRHLVFSPGKPVAYVSNEQGGSVTVYDLNAGTGTLKPVQTLSTLPAGFRDTNACAEIRIHPTGRSVYVANRGHDSIACFQADDKGRLRSLGQTATEKTPRSFDIDPTGRFLYAAGESSGKLAAYAIDPKTGELRHNTTYDVGRMPWWVMAVELPGTR
jgi:6-phosphogluconolactonase